ncbi:MAG: efflux RND transporter periplasmic adaptor subunit [Candidatus Zhuqueibacterota bacterium]
MKKKIIAIALILVVAAIGLTILNMSGSVKEENFQFGEARMGDIINSVSSTGAINAVSTVEVGTQVSGTLDRLHADFNDQVKKGQLLAVLDTIVLKTQVLDAQANVERVEALLEQALADQKRNEPLFSKGLISEAEFLPMQISVKTQQATLKSAQVALDRAERNLRYAYIKSPINGTIIQRNVEEGQTVAASFQTPTLFIIAEDLTKMEIHAQVDESDIGQIKTGQNVTFEVLAYPDVVFTGIVKQVRLQPTTVQNVVNYTVVIDASNDKKLLLPGMTATVDFLIEEKRNVLIVPNSALTFAPPENVANEARAALEKHRASAPDSIKKMMTSKVGAPATGSASGDRSRNFSVVWSPNPEGKLMPIPVMTGSTDGKSTEILQSPLLKSELRVAIGTATAATTKKSEQKQTTQRMPGPPRLF